MSGASKGYVIVSLSITLNNPSSITITVGDINFDVSTDGSVIGKAYLYNATIVPGSQTYASEMHLGEGVSDLGGVVALGKILTAYLTGASVPLLVAGSSTSTSIVPIQSGLSQVKLTTTMNGNTQGLIKKIAVFSDIDMVVMGTATANIELYNPLDTPFTINSIHAETYHYVLCLIPGFTDDITNTEFMLGTVDYAPPGGLTIPARSSVTAEGWPVVLHGENLLQYLAPIADFWMYFNVTQNASVTVGDGFAVENMYYYQKMVDYTIDIPGITDIPKDELQATYCPNLAGVNLTAASLNSTANGTDTSNTTSTVITSTTIAANTTTPLTTIISTETTTPMTTTTEVITTTTVVSSTQETTTTTTNTTEKSTTTDAESTTDASTSTTTTTADDPTFTD